MLLFTQIMFANYDHKNYYAIKLCNEDINVEEVINAIFKKNVKDDRELYGGPNARVEQVHDMHVCEIKEGDYDFAMMILVEYIPLSSNNKTSDTSMHSLWGFVCDYSSDCEEDENSDSSDNSEE